MIKIEDRDWEAMQREYDSGKTAKYIRGKYNCSIATMQKAKRLGWFTPRSRSESAKMVCKDPKYIEKRNNIWTVEKRKKHSDDKKRYYEENPHKHPVYTRVNRKSKISYPERMAYCYFEDMKFNFEHQKRILNYWPDFTIDDSLIIEVDGEYWHDKDRDAKRDKELTDVGYTVVRFTAKDIIAKLNVYFNTSYDITLEESKSRILNIETIIGSERTCEHCNNMYVMKSSHAKQKYCSLKCSGLASIKSDKTHKRKVPRPTATQLIEDLSMQPWTHVGKKYNVSDNAVRKWVKSYNLPTDRKMIKSTYEHSKYMGKRYRDEGGKLYTITHYDWLFVYLQAEGEDRFRVTVPDLELMFVDLDSAFSAPEGIEREVVEGVSVSVVKEPVCEHEYNYDIQLYTDPAQVECVKCKHRKVV